MSLIKDKKGVLDLPLRMVVMIIVGVTVLSIVVGYVLMNAGEYGNLSVSVSSMELEEGLNRKIEVTVTNQNGKPIKDAVVMCTGCDAIATAKTDGNGKAVLFMDLFIKSKEREEDFIDIVIKAKGYEEVNLQDYIRVAKADYSEFLDAVWNYLNNEIKESEKLDIEDYRIIDEFPVEIKNIISKGYMDVYILDPGVANQIPDKFNISFIGDGMTNFHYKVIELYGSDLPSESNFPDPNSVNEIEWNDGFVEWIPKEMQGCNSVYSVNLRHQSPRTIVILLERKTEKVTIEIEDLNLDLGKVEISDWFGNGEYTFYLDIYKHYSDFYNLYSTLIEMVEIINRTASYLHEKLSEYSQELIQLAQNPQSLNEKTVQFLKSLFNNIPFNLLVDNLGNRYSIDVLEFIGDYDNRISQLHSMYKDNLRRMLRDLGVPEELLDTAVNIVISMPPFNYVEGCFNSYQFFISFLDKIIDALKLKFNVYLDTYGGVNAGICFGFETGAFNDMVSFDGKARFFIDYIGYTPPIPTIGSTLDGTLKITDPFFDRKSTINLHINPNFISNSDRDYSLKIGLKLEPDLHVTTPIGLDIGGQVGGKIGLVLSLSDTDIKETVENILRNVLNDFMDDGRLQSIETGIYKYSIIIQNNEYSKVNPIVLPLVNHMLALKTTIDIIAALIDDFNQLGLIDKISVGITISIEGGVGGGALQCISGDIAGGIKLTLFSRVSYWRELLDQIGGCFDYFGNLLYGASALAFCEVFDIVNEEEVREQAQNALTYASEGFENLLPNIADELLDNVFIGIGFFIKPELGVGASVISIDIIEGSLISSMNLRFFLYRFIPIAGEIFLPNGIYAEIVIELSSSIEGTAGIPKLNIGAFASFETSKKVIKFSVQSIQSDMT